MASINVFGLSKLAVATVGAATLQAKVASQSGGLVTTFLNSLGLTLATELGDKTFFIAAILATQHNLLVVYLGCFGALAFMTVLSALIGTLGASILGTVVPRKYTQLISIGLLVYFGLSMVFDSLRQIASDGTEDEEEGAQAEAKEQLETMLFGREEDEDDDSRASEDDEESLDGEGEIAPIIKLPYGREVNLKPLVRFGRGTLKESRKALRYVQKSANGYINYVLDMLDTEDVALLWQIFTMVALAEFGDKSQVSTIAMASSSGFLGVALGGFIGHAICSAIAVSGGFILADQVSTAQIDFVGGLLFLGFATHSFLNID